jgi:serine/threonine-protein kinase
MLSFIALTPGREILHYRIVNKLGEGGMGVVYQAVDTRLDRPVALKFLSRANSSPDQRRRFADEARAASALNHPNIVTIYDIADTPEGNIIAMEYVEGKTLDAVIPPAGLPPRDALHYALQIADALARAHRAAIIHRDLKPANVMVGPDSIVKLLDFGLAKFKEWAPGAAGGATVTLAGTIVGTVAYMSPEQAEGRPVDERTDIFAFGAVLYEMLTGKRAFPGQSSVSIMGALLRDPPPLLRQIGHMQPPGLDAVVSRCLEKDPARRFARMDEVRAALDAVKSGSSDVRIIPSQIETPSIVVLPLTNLSADKENEYFSDGLTEEIINALSRAPGLRVIARTSSFRYRGETDLRKVGADLNVSTALGGSVRKAGNRVRVSVQLTRIEDETELWSERYDRDMTDIFAIQDEIAASIVSSLRLRLSGEGAPAAPTRRQVDPEAYNLTLRANHMMWKLTGGGLAKAQELYADAIAIDAGCAPAHAGLAYSYLISTIMGHPASREALEEAKRSALQAIALDDSLAEAHSTLAAILGYLDRDWTAAAREHRRALELNPSRSQVHYWYSHNYLRPLRRLEEATVEMQRALELDPASSSWTALLAVLFHYRGMYQQAIELAGRSIELDPANFLGYWFRALARAQTGSPAALADIERALELSGGNTWVMGNVGWVHSKLGQAAEARALLERLESLATEQHVSAYGLAVACMGAGELEKMWHWLAASEQRYEPTFFWCQSDNFWRPLHDHPRYQALMQKVGLAGERT